MPQKARAAGAETPDRPLTLTTEFTHGKGYAIMLMPRDELIAMHGKVDHDHVDAMMADFAGTAESLKATVLMLDTAFLRIMASCAAAHKKGTKFPGVHDMRRKDRKSRKAR